MSALPHDTPFAFEVLVHLGVSAYPHHDTIVKSAQHGGTAKQQTYIVFRRGKDFLDCDIHPEV